MIYSNLGTIDPWIKYSRQEFSSKTLLVIGKGNIGSEVIKTMKHFMNVVGFDISENKLEILPDLLKVADCISLHILKVRIMNLS